MAINVICPGCMKRFQVSDRFAGLKGPCPNCNSIINIPKAEVKIHGAEEFASGGKTSTGKLILKPIGRLQMDFDPVRSGLIALGVFAVFVVAALFGRITLTDSMRDVIGGLGVFLVSFPLSLFGYQILRDREELFILTGLDLYKKVGTCAAVYAVLWILFEWFIWYMNADAIFVWVYFTAFAVFAMLAAHAILDISIGPALMHYLIFFFVILLLRGIMNLGWLWVAVQRVGESKLPPPPIIPGM